MSSSQESEALVAVRRRFLAACGRFGAATTPAVAPVLSISRQNFSVAASATGESGGAGRHHGYSYLQHHRRRRHRRQTGNRPGNAGGDDASAWTEARGSNV